MSTLGSRSGSYDTSPRPCFSGWASTPSSRVRHPTAPRLRCPLRYVLRARSSCWAGELEIVPELEEGRLKRRIDAAAKYVPLENLCLSPQCGFSSTHHGNKLTADDQWKDSA